MIKNHSVNETLQELVSIENDIKALSNRLKSGETDQRHIPTVKKYLLEAIQMHSEVKKSLEDHYCACISLEQLMFDIQN